MAPASSGVDETAREGLLRLKERIEALEAQMATMKPASSGDGRKDFLEGF